MMIYIGLAIGFSVGGFLGAMMMCLVIASGKASRAEEKELEKFKQDNKGEPNG